MRNYKTWLAVPLICALLVWGLSWETPATAGPGTVDGVDPTAGLHADVSVAPSADLSGRRAAPDPGPDRAGCWGWGDWWIGQKVAGAWYNEFMHHCDGDPEYDPEVDYPGTGMITLGRDGTVSWTSRGGVGGDQPGRGSWTRTGWREITMTVLMMGYNPVDPTIQWTCRTRIIWQFDEDFQTAMGEGCTNCFSPDQDPLGDETVFTCLFVDYTSCRRINVLPCIGVD